mmetsp:Transcript_10401/g.23385  ORF Transcript_10401/g.23385 Transcript_10401/m.23385 type:complete len:357 (+) Transcript_10401:88-1158(+)|eukprot:CAMPEP_0170612802 /NCGR_PEP_ID=MMETSP0224-20130122/23923_1 /TAXON_ID=285029 /ORGANISM="Togula jolla, Strain CCCM 725" /LENGTH=356 /DNA_ID=CAMNT_0010938341 /DNA_START=88 /DNA_END=1158 /DNA_ORIENTATION=+
MSCVRLLVLVCLSASSCNSAFGEVPWIAQDSVSAALSEDSPCDQGEQCSVELLQVPSRRSHSHGSSAKSLSAGEFSGPNFAAPGLDNDLVETSAGDEGPLPEVTRTAWSWPTSRQSFAILSLLLVLLVSLLEGWWVWQNNRRFLACQAKMRNVMLAWGVPGETRLLCAICVEFLSTQAPAKEVEFYCGHRFHKKCVNHWLTDHPEAAASCPICAETTLLRPCTAMAEEVGAGPELPLQQDQEQDEALYEVEVQAEINEKQREVEHTDAEGLRGPSSSCTTDSPSLRTKGSRTAFIVGILREKYPDMISSDMAARWPSFSSDVWLAEFQKPKAPSALARIYALWAKRLCCDSKVETK